MLKILTNSSHPWWMILALCLVHVNHGFVLPRGPGKIVGGDAIPIEDAPWAAALLITLGSGAYHHNCGGSLISSKTVLTAAHCLEGFFSTDYTIRVGSSNKYAGGELIESIDAIYHDEFVMRTFTDDIGVVILAKAATISNSIRPIALPNAKFVVADGAMTTAVGWGRTKEGGPITLYLRSVSVPIVNQELCKFLNRRNNDVTENMVCAGYVKTGGKDACNGDSGGSLAVKDVIIGITSWGVGCARPGKPGVYTRVTKYLDWINAHTVE